MFTSAPTRFRSRYTGQEIEQLLSTVPLKIDTSYIVNDFTGGVDKIASAELAKNLDSRLAKFNDPNYMKSLFLTIPNSVIFTNDMLNTLNKLGSSFRGSFADAPSRNIAIQTTDFKGGEITFLVNNGSGLQELSYWDNLSLKWKPAKWIADANLTINSPNAGDTAIYSMDRRLYRLGKYIIYAETANDTYVWGLTIAARPGSSDFFYQIDQEFGSQWTGDPFSVYGNEPVMIASPKVQSDPTNNFVNIIMTGTVSAMVYRFYKIAEA